MIEHSSRIQQAHGTDSFARLGSGLALRCVRVGQGWVVVMYSVSGQQAAVCVSVPVNRKQNRLWHA